VTGRCYFGSWAVSK